MVKKRVMEDEMPNGTTRMVRPARLKTAPWLVIRWALILCHLRQHVWWRSDVYLSTPGPDGEIGWVIDACDRPRCGVRRWRKAYLCD